MLGQVLLTVADTGPVPALGPGPALWCTPAGASPPWAPPALPGPRAALALVAEALQIVPPVARECTLKRGGGKNRVSQTEEKVMRDSSECFHAPFILIW